MVSPHLVSTENDIIIAFDARRSLEVGLENI